MENSVRIEMNATSENIDDECTREQNALDKYIYNLYKTKLKFKISESEVKCIQTCVETLIKRLVVRTKRSQVYRKYVEEATTVSTITETDEMNVLKSYKDQALNEKENVLSVGSFYEGTRNTFPDEFDYIVVLADIPDICSKFYFQEYNKNARFEERWRMLLNGFCVALRHVVNENTKDFTQQDLQLHRFVRISGPATKLEFTYKNGQRLIHVDLAPAVRLNIDERFKDGYLDISSEDQWYHRFIKTGTYLKMLFHKRGHDSSLEGRRMDISIIETEFIFMTSEVSFNHKLAYMFLKYILSRQNEEMQDLLFSTKEYYFDWKKCDFSSYAVKNLLYHHVKKCSSDSSVGVCCLDMLVFLHSRFTKYRPCYLKSLLGFEITLCKDRVLAKQLEQVLNGYILTLEKLRKGSYKGKHKPVFKALLTTPYMKQRQMDKYWQSYWPVFKTLAFIIFIGSLCLFYILHNLRFGLF